MFFQLNVLKTDSIRSIKYKILEEKDVTPLRQKLFLRGVELVNLDQTVAELEIYPNTVIEYYEIPSSETDLDALEDLNHSKKPEKGFEGTGLTGFSGSPMKETSSPSNRTEGSRVPNFDFPIEQPSSSDSKPTLTKAQMRKEPMIESENEGENHTIDEEESKQSGLRQQDLITFDHLSGAFLECPQCTLKNPLDREICDACKFPLDVPNFSPLKKGSKVSGKMMNEEEIPDILDDSSTAVISSSSLNTSKRRRKNESNNDTNVKQSKIEPNPNPNTSNRPKRRRQDATDQNK